MKGSDSIAARLGRGLCGVWRRQATMVAGGVVYEADGLVVALTNLSDPSLNVALVEREPEDPGAALRLAAELFDAHGLRLGLDLDRGRHPGVEDAARQRGLRPVASRPGMAQALSGFVETLPPEGVRIEHVDDRRGVSAVIDLQIEAFSWRRTVAERFLALSVLSIPGLRLYLARLRGVPVGTAMVHLDDGAIGIFGVATSRSARNRGIATAVTGRAMQEGRTHADLAWLLATSEGRPLYERMGFQVVSDWTVWVS